MPRRRVSRAPHRLRSDRTLAALIALAILLVPEFAPAADNVRPRNVVLIVADDLGEQLGCCGNSAVRTPHIDRLAREGTQFRRAYCTTASCSASRSVLLTGLFNHATGHYGHAHADHHFSTYESVRTLPVLMAEAGYRTCSIGKYHVAPEQTYHFETYRNEGTQGNRNSVRMARNARDWISEKDERPFFLYWCSADPHRGGGPGGFGNLKDPEGYPGVTPVRYRPEDVVVPSWLPDNDDVRKELAEFYEAVSRLDQGVGALLDALRETGHEDDTLVLFLSDNGPPFPGAKTTLYDPGARLPLIVRHPDASRRRGVTSEALVSWVDVTPTILDFCGVTPKPAPPVRPMENSGKPPAGKPQPVAFHGRSFLTAVGSDKAAGFDEIASHTFHEVTMYYPMRALIQGKYKYIWNVAHSLPYPFASDLYASPTWQGVLKRKDTQYGRRAVDAYLHRPPHELYNLEADPDELHNLADAPAHRQRLEAMQGALKDWQKRTRDPWITKWEYE